MNNRHLLFISMLFCSMHTMSQNTNYTVSMNGIGDFKIDMTKAQVEKLTGQSIQLRNLLSTDEWTRDTIAAIYKGLEFSLIFEKQYINEKTNDIILAQVYSNSTLLKTPSGIVVADDVCKILSTYNGYTMMIYPEYENNYSVKSKTRSNLTLQSEESNHVIIFHLNNNKVSGFSVAVWEGD